MTLSVYERRKLAEIEQQLSSDPNLRMLADFRLPPPARRTARPPLPPPLAAPPRKAGPQPRGQPPRSGAAPGGAGVPARPRRRDTALLIATVILLVSGPALLVPAFMASMPWLAIGAMVTPVAAALLSAPTVRTAAGRRGHRQR